MPSLQKVFSDEVADETGSLGEAARPTKCRWILAQERSSESIWHSSGTRQKWRIGVAALLESALE
jgi:hypothetical protein